MLFRSLLGDLVLDEDTVPSATEFERPVKLTERVQDVLQDARALSEILHVAEDARLAARGDESARERLSRHAEAHQLSQALTVGLTADATKSEPIEQWITLLVGDALTKQIWGVRPHVVAEGPGRVSLQLLCDTLRTFCYLSVTYAIAREPLAICPECGRPFVVADKRQKFCLPACSNRARFRAYKDRLQAKAKPVEGRERR